jgi:hypothetical protein
LTRRQPDIADSRLTLPTRGRAWRICIVSAATGPGSTLLPPFEAFNATLKVQGSTRCKLSICMRDVEQSVVRECSKPFTERSHSLLSHPLLQFSQTARKGHTVPRHWKVLWCVLIITFS